MLPSTMPDAAPPQTSRVRIPQHVVYRSFSSETVVLNLATGQYHGLNATAGRMFAALEHSACLRDAASTVANEYSQPQAAVERDMGELCIGLLARGLIELDGDPPR
jgi:hypothetical protein